MLAGLKEARQKLFPLSPRLPSKRKGMNIIEVIIVMVILGGVLSSLLVVLNTGYISNSISRKKFELQESTRRALGWIVRDIRKTTAVEIKTNSPSASHVKFRTYCGYSAPNPVWSSNYIEYTYDSDLDTLTRRDYSKTAGEDKIYFYNIIQAPFAIDQAWIDGSENKLEVTVNSQDYARGNIAVNFSLTTEIKIRNE